ncbi:band 4.1-like protein 4 isoform X1 [Lutzomyia longipalpis]|uniref:band 4.1-like protein 4 isoform X1 n=1 Tax=Lutzomyia longipalpis TaxID=7200 RepID=UPI00248458EF|nr:band 4.1-like protein 4 isoform X1 [Lutzomyia longipalpis]
MDCLCRSSKVISVRIVLLDETDFLYEIKDDLQGQALLDVIFSRLNLMETAYFGIRYLDQENQTHWLDPQARISRQLKGCCEPYDLYFGVKFYAADPCKLLEEITRYQLFLQVKQDVLQGRLPVSFELAAELGAYVVQSELGDYDSRRHSPGYVSEFRLLSNQTRELESRVAELHQQLKGLSPSAAELNYLDKVKWHDMYGVDLHPVLGEDSVEYFLGLTPSGIVVLRNKTTVAHYYWPRIAKVYFKGKYFMLRVCDKNNEVSTYGFETPRKSACKHLWRCCVEHHAFFRLVRVAPMQPPAGTTDLFALGSRFRYSGRTEKQAVRDAMSHGRTPPAFTRTPSRRQPRRVIDELLDAKSSESSGKQAKHEIKTISIPQPAQNSDVLYRSACSIPAAVNSRSFQRNGSSTGAPDSPRSTRSAPWVRSQQRGLFGVTASPRSVRSASRDGPTHRYRSSSVESHSSNDSRSCRRHKSGKNRRTSDNESEFSRASGRSGRSHNSHRKHRRQRSKHRRNDSGSENDSMRTRSYSGHRVSAGSVELIDSGTQWREVQRKQAELNGYSSIQQASVIKSNLIPKHHAGDSDHSHHRSRKHRKHRSPSESRTKIWSSELAKHLQFDLVDTTGMTEAQLREIPYTVVETNSIKRPNTNSLKVHKSSTNKDRVDRIRGIYLTETNETPGVVDGSIRSASTISSNRDADRDRNNGLVRMMSSLSMGDFISPTGSSLSPLDGSGLRVSHEHTDSGLGADQDYAYSSERSSDSTKYGTNKSSGASVTSGQHKMTNGSQAGGTSLSNHHHSVSTNRKPPVHPNRQANSLKTSTSVPVHNNNNYHAANNNTTSLLSNLVYHNDLHYTFSLNRIPGGGFGGGGGFTSPISAMALSPSDGHGSCSIRAPRGTKSDIGVPINRRHLTKLYSNATAGVHSVGKLASVKSENQLAAFHISGASTDYLDNYKTDTGNTFAALNTSSAHNNNFISNNNHNGSDQLQRTNVNNTTLPSPHQMTTGTAVGPLLYLDTEHQSAMRYVNNASRFYSNVSNLHTNLPSYLNEGHTYFT